MLLVAQNLIQANGQVDERDFLARLAKVLPSMRGAGPTTPGSGAALSGDGRAAGHEGSSIGAAMRALPVGWATPVAAAARRRELTIRLSRTTHGAPEAIACAGVVAEMAAWAAEQHSISAVVAAGVREAEHLAGLYALRSAALQKLRQAAGGHWSPSTAKLAADAVTTLASVLHVLREATGLAMAMKHTVALGGDTDTAAAIVGGLLGCQAENVEAEIPWLPRVALPDSELIDAAATGLHDLRRGAYS